MSMFQIRRPGASRNVGNLKCVDARILGLAMGSHATDATLCAVAGPANFIGFLTRPVVSVADHNTALKEAQLFPSKYAYLPFALARDYVSLEPADEIEASGADRIAQGSDTGAITSSSAPGTLMGFADGKFRALQSGDTAYYSISAHLGNDADGDFIVRFHRI